MLIDVEGVGQVEFPDDATQEEIQSTLNKNHPPPLNVGQIVKNDQRDAFKFRTGMGDGGLMAPTEEQKRVQREVAAYDPKNEETLGQELGGLALDPLVKIANVTAETPWVRKLALGIVNANPTGYQPKKQLTDADIGPAAGVMAGTINVAKSVPEFLTSPVGALTLGAGTAAAGAAKTAAEIRALTLAHRGLGLAFAPGMVKSGAEQLGEASVTGDPQKFVEGTGALLMGGAAGAHGARIGEGALPLTTGDQLRLFNKDIANTSGAQLIGAQLRGLPGNEMLEPLAPEGQRRLGLRLSPNALEGQEVVPLVEEGLRQAQTGIRVPGEQEATDLLSRQPGRFRIGGPIIVEAGHTPLERPGEGPAEGGRVSYASPAEAEAVPSARQSTVERVGDGATSEYNGNRYVKRNGKWYSTSGVVGPGQDINLPLWEGSDRASASAKDRDAARFVSEIERRAKPAKEAPGPEQPPDLAESVVSIVNNKDRYSLEQMRAQIAGAAAEDVVLEKLKNAPPGSKAGLRYAQMMEERRAAGSPQAPGVGNRSQANDVLRVIDQRLWELKTGGLHRENEALRKTINKEPEPQPAPERGPLPTVTVDRPGGPLKLGEGGSDATSEGTQPEGGKPKPTGTPPGSPVPANQTQVRKGKGKQAGGGDSLARGGEGIQPPPAIPVAEEPVQQRRMGATDLKIAQDTIGNMTREGLARAKRMWEESPDSAYQKHMLELIEKRIAESDVGKVHTALGGLDHVDKRFNNSIALNNFLKRESKKPGWDKYERNVVENSDGSFDVTFVRSEPSITPGSTNVKKAQESIDANNAKLKNGKGPTGKKMTQADRDAIARENAIHEETIQREKEAGKASAKGVDLSQKAAVKRTEWLDDITPPSTRAGAEPWNSLENSYKKAKAAQDAVPGVPLKDIVGVEVRSGPYAGSPVVDYFFVEKNKIGQLSDNAAFEKKYPTREFRIAVDPNIEPGTPTKGSPTFEEWQKGKRPDKRNLKPDEIAFGGGKSGRNVDHPSLQAARDFAQAEKSKFGGAGYEVKIDRRGPQRYDVVYTKKPTAAEAPKAAPKGKGKVGQGPSPSGLSPEEEANIISEGDKGKLKQAPSEEGQAMAKRFGMRYDGELMGRWMFTLLDRNGKESTSIVTRDGATPEEIRAKYESKAAEYGGAENAPAPLKTMKEELQDISSEYGQDKLPDSLIKSLTEKGTVSIKDALTHITEAGGRWADLTRELLSGMDNKGLNVPINLEHTSDARSYYSLSGDRIALDYKRASIGSLIHEIVHGGTSRKIPGWLLGGESELWRGSTYDQILKHAVKDPTVSTEIKNLISVYRRAIELHPQREMIEAFLGDANSISSLGGHYGMGNLEEFMSETLSKHEFQKWLESIPGLEPNKNMFQSFIDAVRKIFGISAKNGTLLEDAIRATADMLKKERGEEDIHVGTLFEEGERKIPEPRPEDLSTDYVGGSKGSRPAMTMDYLKKVSPSLTTPEAWKSMIERMTKGDLALTQSAEHMGYVLRGEGDAALPKLKAAMEARDQIKEQAYKDFASKDMEKQNQAMKLVQANQFATEAIESATRNDKTKQWYSKVDTKPIEIPEGDTTFDEIASIKNRGPAPEPQVEMVTPLDKASGSPRSATDMLIERLERLKAAPNKGGVFYSLPHPNAIKGIAKSVWNGTIDAAILAIKGGKLAKDAIADAMTYLKRNASGYDAAKVQANLESMLKDEGVIPKDRVKPGKPGSVPKTVPPPQPQAVASASNPLQKFAESTLLPFGRALKDVAGGARDLIIDTFSPASNAKQRSVDILFSSKGYKEKVITEAAAAMEGISNKFRAMPQKDQLAFIDRIKRGVKQPTPELQQAADLLRKWDDRLYAEVAKYRPGLPYMDHHMRVLWKVIPGSPEARGLSPQQIASKRPWQGSRGFTRKHVLNDMSEGIALGGVPITYNPVEMFMLHAQDAMKFVAANRGWEALKKVGDAQFVKHGTRAPEGFSKIEDTIAKAYFRTDEGMITSRGEWWVEHGAARMLNNYLSRDYIREKALGRGLVALKNGTTAIELGLSPFHAIFESNEVMGSSYGLGLAKMFSGRPFEGLRDIMAAPISPYTTSKLGGLAIRYAKDSEGFRAAMPEAYDWFTKKYPEAKQLIDDLFSGGGQASMHEDYRSRATRGFRQAINENDYLRALVKAVPALNEVAMKPLFEKYIPRLKVGMFLREYAFELDRRSTDIETGKLTRGELAQQTWAFIEDRFGELNWDNLYWDRTMKTAMQLMFRSVTWKLGNLRGFGKAGRDAVAELGVNWWREGRAPRMTLPMGWLVGMTAITAVQASIISKVATGKYPWELAEDSGELMRNLVFPRIDANDKSQRVSIPTYWRDAVHLSHSPTDYVRTSMTGEIGRIMDVWDNKDFYGTQVYNPDDPDLRKVYDATRHMVPLPFGLSSYIAAHQTGATGARAAAGFMGFTKAPFYVSYSPAEKAAYQYIREKMPIGSRTREQFERGVQERIVTEKIRRGEMSAPEAVEQGLIDQNRRDIVGRRSAESPLQHAIKSLDVDEAMNVLKKVSPDERDEILWLVRRKVHNSESITPDKRSEYLGQLDDLEQK